MTVLKLHALQLCFHFDLTRFRSAKVCEVNQSHAYIYMYMSVYMCIYYLFISTHINTLARHTKCYICVVVGISQITEITNIPRGLAGAKQ